MFFIFSSLFLLSMLSSLYARLRDAELSNNNTLPTTSDVHTQVGKVNRMGRGNEREEIGEQMEERKMQVSGMYVQLNTCTQLL